MSKITVQTSVNVPVDKAWELWTTPEHICHWSFASSDWHAPRAENNLHIDGTFCIRMETKDGSSGFDFEGVYDDLILHKYISYVMADGRTVSINFKALGASTEIKETFDPENQNPLEMQKQGWQAILNQFKKYAESKL